ncbi:Nitroalkane oxidase [Colletotrichum trifolii]|uniref:Nitroalkane oxidase n=1 Tax=Colletotrichum trifolii TaxID=5466 RepID=A0A4R8REE2_COLTR|nr:Nitroalkane oxidase [Colletotrichum trifolii]
MIDFALSSSQRAARDNAATCASQVLRGAYDAYTKLPNDGKSRFLSTKNLFEKATAAGVIKSLVPPHLGGTGGTLLEAALVTEELFAEEPGVALNILTISLGLMPVVFSGAGAELQRELAEPFLKGEGAPLAAFQWSEPGGTANFMEVGGMGVQTTARFDGEDGCWVVNGEKIWAGNGAGWDGNGADLQVVFCRDVAADAEKPVDGAMLLAVPRSVMDENPEGAFGVVEYQETPGFTVHCGPRVAFRNLRVPGKYMLARGRDAVRAVDTAFAATGAMVGSMGAGIMRTAFLSALRFAKEDSRGGRVKVAERQSAADLLVSLKTRIDTARLLAWRAASALDRGEKNAVELCSQAKIYGSEAAVKGVAEAMRVVGIESYTSRYPFARLVQEAAVLSIFDGGNQGVRRRVVQRAMMEADYDPFAELDDSSTS